MVAHASSRMISVAFRWCGAQDRMPHLALTRRLGQFNLADELRNKPRGGVSGRHLLVEEILFRSQGLHCFIKRFQRRSVEARADMTHASSCVMPMGRGRQPGEMNDESSGYCRIAIRFC
jgi:hypothetical protein